MSLLKRLGTNVPPPTEEEEGGLGRRLSQPANAVKPAPAPPATGEPQKPLQPAAPPTPATEGGLLGRMGAAGPAERTAQPAPPSPTELGLLGRISQAATQEEEDSSSFGRKARRPEADPLTQLKFRIQDRVIRELGPRITRSSQAEIRATVERAMADVLSAEGLLLGQADRLRLLKGIEAEVWGYGPLQTLLDDTSVTEVMANGPDHVYVERNGRVELSPVRFYDEEHMLRVVDRILTPIGRRVDESSPMADARLPDGSRVNVVIPPLALNGPTITVRKFAHSSFAIEDLIRLGTVSAEAALFMAAGVWARLNIIVSGGASSGKTTLLNILSSFILPDERIVTVETTAELSL